MFSALLWDSYIARKGKTNTGVLSQKTKQIRNTLFAVASYAVVKKCLFTINKPKFIV